MNHYGEKNVLVAIFPAHVTQIELLAKGHAVHAWGGLGMH
jgi:hypothetical protein